ncbi:MAG: IS1182 family transposase, partial [bacterium]
LVDHRHEIFRDEDYAPLYCSNNGRNSVPPSILATACVLQSYHRTSDEETVQRATYDVRWCVALGTELAEQPFAKSTLQEFRAKLILNDRALHIFQRSLAYAREKGYLKSRKMRVAMDTTHILGKGAVKDTYNLLADGIKKLYTCLKHQDAPGLIEKFKEKFKRYFGKSFKGEANIDWDDETARQRLLNELADDATALLALAKQTIATADSDEEKINTIRKAAQLLSQLLLQDIQTDEEGQAQIIRGVSQDRIVSTTDPEMRHGRKSSKNRFDGHKAAIATDLDSELITAVDVVAGNAHDGETATSMVEKSQENTGNQVESAVGDCAYGTAEVREQFEESETELVAKVPKSPRSDHFTKHDFEIDLENKKVTCPQGHTTTNYRTVNVPFGKKKAKRATLKFIFPGEVCAACGLRQVCIRSKQQTGKIIQLHPREDLLQKARAKAATESFEEHYQERVAVEHSIARLVQRGIRQSRFFGRKRTLWQVALAAAVVNFKQIATKEAEVKQRLRRFLRYILHGLQELACRIRSASNWLADAPALTQMVYMHTL